MLKSTTTTLFVLNAAILTFVLSVPTSFAQGARPGQGENDNQDVFTASQGREEDKKTTDKREELPNPPDRRPSKKVDNRIDNQDSNDESETGPVGRKGGRNAVARRPSAPSLAASFGKGTPGSAGRLLMGLASAPRLGNRDFAIVGKNAPARSIGALLVAPATAALYGGSQPLGRGLVVYVDVLNNSTKLIEGLTSDTAGQWNLPAPLPTDPALADLKIVIQSIWYDSAKGMLASSNGLVFRMQ